jgi:hypothetical protein
MSEDDEQREEKSPGEAEQPISDTERRNADLERFFLDYLAESGVWPYPVQCPICKTTNWTMGDGVDMPIRYKPGRVYTMLPVRCANCSYTMFFGANAIGLFDDDGEPRPAPSRERQMQLDEIEAEPEPDPESEPEPEAEGEPEGES